MKKHLSDIVAILLVPIFCFVPRDTAPIILCLVSLFASGVFFANYQFWSDEKVKSDLFLGTIWLIVAFIYLVLHCQFYYS